MCEECDADNAIGPIYRDVRDGSFWHLARLSGGEVWLTGKDGDERHMTARELADRYDRVSTGATLDTNAA